MRRAGKAALILLGILAGIFVGEQQLQHTFSDLKTLGHTIIPSFFSSRCAAFGGLGLYRNVTETPRRGRLFVM